MSSQDLYTIVLIVEEHPRTTDSSACEVGDRPLQLCSQMTSVFVTHDKSRKMCARIQRTMADGKNMSNPSLGNES